MAVFDTAPVAVDHGQTGQSQDGAGVLGVSAVSVDASSDQCSGLRPGQLSEAGETLPACGAQCCSGYGHTEANGAEPWCTWPPSGRCIQEANKEPRRGSVSDPHPQSGSRTQPPIAQQLSPHPVKGKGEPARVATIAIESHGLPVASGVPAAPELMPRS